MLIKFSKIVKSKLLWPIIALLIVLPATIGLSKPGDYYNMHDDMQLIRQLELEKCLKDGQIPCRWTPDLGYGYGYPLFNFYPPLPYFVGQVYRTFGISYINTVKLTAITQIILCAVSMYILASSVFGPIGGVFSTIFYTYAPYHALNIYVRGAMNEAWAAVFFPLIFYFSKELIQGKKIKNIIFLGLSFSGLFLSHNPMVITFTPYFALWCLYWLYTENKNNIKNYLIPSLKLLISGVLAFSLSAFFSLPVLFETKYVQIESMFKNYYSFDVHFTDLNQLFISSFWGDGPSVWGPEDKMSFMIGYAHWILPLLILAFFVFIWIKDKKIDKKIVLPILIIFLGFFTAFLTHQRSVGFWLAFPIIQKIQFPWRFLNHTVFLLSLSVGILPYILSKYISKKNSLYVLSGLTIIVLTLNINYFKAVTHGPINDEQKFSGIAWRNQITSGIYDYLPKTASTAAKYPAGDYVDIVEPKSVKYQITNGKKGTNWQLFNLKTDSKSKVTLAILAFPDFEIYDNNKKIDYQIEPELGRLTINIEAGDHQIYVKFVDTPIRKISNILSLFAWGIVSIFLTKPLWNKLISKK